MSPDAPAISQCHRCREHVPEATIWVFGSRARGDAKPRSDLDLAIQCSAPLSVRRLALLEDAFTESDLPVRVDLVDYATIDDRFRALIKEEREALPL